MKFAVGVYALISLGCWAGMAETIHQRYERGEIEQGMDWKTGLKIVPLAALWPFGFGWSLSYDDVQSTPETDQ